jgi:hypothetical protein
MIKEVENLKGYFLNSCKGNCKSCISMHIGKGRSDVIRIGKIICKMHEIMS